MKKAFVILLACLMSLTAYGGFADTPHVAGDFQGWDAGANPMTETALGSGIWEAAFTGVTLGRHEFKITQGDWGDAYPGDNSWLYADASGEVTVTFTPNPAADGWEPTANRLGTSTATDWTIAGSFQGWDNANPATAMTPIGGGIYVFNTILTAGTYEWKPVVTGTWDAISWDTRTANTANMTLNLVADAEVNFYVDEQVGALKAEIVPEPATMLLMGLGSLVAIRRKK